MGEHLYSSDELAEFRKAYFVLDVPYTTPATLIKKSYRTLIKKWHPDLFQVGSALQAQATERMKEINDSYARIRHAPLRYHISSYPEAEERRQQRAAAGPSGVAETKDSISVNDVIEAWLSFILGSVGGAVIGLLWLLIFYEHKAVALTVYIIFIVMTGLCTVRWGNRFWEAIFRSWWLWP